MRIERECKIKENKKEMRRPCKKKNKEVILVINVSSLIVTWFKNNDQMLKIYIISEKIMKRCSEKFKLICMNMESIEEMKGNQETTALASPFRSTLSRHGLQKS